MIGQSQVTEPLMTALRTNRVNHAYLFSGPRGCGKTTSARILARCLNCAEGPTDTPCGKCESCVELGRGGQGSLDVVEIDAASHNGVDDARDIRERAIFAPARDRYKIFILDEAHMVTPQGFNALLKIVEEPPEHVKFIFATTEPDKVIGTIRSRTHHYPFRLVPPAQMLDYVQQLCESEGMQVAPGVLPLVVRAGGGSPRDTLSLLDQLIAGSEGETIEYERAVALLGYTHAALLDEVVDAIGAADAASAFAAVDRVIQTGQDPRRFVEDLLERLRDLIIVAATSADAAAAVLRGTPQEELDRMSVQARAFGAAELSRCADIVNAALTEMTGATSPRLHLELMIARMLVPASDATERGALARVERLERRVGVEGGGGAVPTAPSSPAPPRAVEPAAPVATRAAEQPARERTNSAASAHTEGQPSADQPPVAERPQNAAPQTSASSGLGASGSAPAAEAGAPSSSGAASSEDPAVAQAAAFAAAAAAKKGVNAGAASGLPAGAGSAASSWATPGVTDDRPAAPVGPVTTQQVKDAWPEILESVAEASRSAWAVVYTASVRSLDGDVLALSFPSAKDVESFRGAAPGSKDAASEVLRQAIVDLLGVKVKFVAKPAGADGGAGGAARPPAPPSGGRGAGADARSESAPPAPGPSAATSAPSREGSAATPASASAPVSAPARASAARGDSASTRSSASASGPAVGWETVAIPGAATAVLERPREHPAPEETVADATRQTVPESEQAAASTRPVQEATSTVSAAGPASAMASGEAPTTAATDADGWYVGPDAPDDDEPPFPEDQSYAAEPELTATNGAVADATRSPAPDASASASAAGSTTEGSPSQASSSASSAGGDANPNRRGCGRTTMAGRRHPWASPPLRDTARPSCASCWARSSSRSSRSSRARPVSRVGRDSACMKVSSKT
nr:DNA polymerase III subunit gamma and tau [Humibacter ginsenosidimutans]